MIGARLTDVPGASDSYVGGVISYATRLKATLAGVSRATLAELGPVAAGTAVEMARGVAERCSADWGLATTGVAGPDTQDGHPVGQVFVAVSHQASDLLAVRELLLEGDRWSIRQQAAAAALGLLAEALGI
jgi:nicotinamide-nucleotide amidase